MAGSLTIISGNIPNQIGQLETTGSVSFDIAFVSSSYADIYVSSSATASLREAEVVAFGVNGINVAFYSGSTAKTNTADTIYINSVPFATTAANFTATASAVFNATASAQNSATTYADLQGISSAVSASTGIKFGVGTVGQYAYPNVIQNPQINFVTSGSTVVEFSGATMYAPAGSGVVTGSFAVITALADTDLTISGSELGEARFNLSVGNTFTATSASVAANIIEAITVNNAYGSVLAQTLA
jgi:hypothetical protein